MSLFTDAISSMRPSQTIRPRRDGYNWSIPTVSAGSIELVADLTASYAQIYQSQPWVHAATNKLTRAVGALPLKAYEREGPDRQRLYEGELHRLMSQPFAAKTPSYWKQHIVGATIVWGNAIFVKLGMNDRNDVPEEIVPAPSIGWSVGEGDTYVWQSERGEFYPFPRWQIIHFQFWDTSDNGFGTSAYEPLRRTLAIEDAAGRFGVAAFKNGVRPASVIRSDQELSETVIKRLKANIENLYGSVDKAFRVAILEQGLDWKPMTHNLKDAALVEHRKLGREEVASVLDVPQPSIGILENSNFASVRELHQMFYQDSLGPYIKMAEETIKRDLIDDVPDFENQYVEFDMGAVLRGDINSRSVAYQRFISAGVYTPNEIRALENLPRSDNPAADEIHIPMNLSPNAAVSGADDQGDVEDPEADL